MVSGHVECAITISVVHEYAHTPRSEEQATYEKVLRHSELRRLAACWIAEIDAVTVTAHHSRNVGGILMLCNFLQTSYKLPMYQGGRSSQ